MRLAHAAGRQRRRQHAAWLRNSRSRAPRQRTQRHRRPQRCHALARERGREQRQRTPHRRTSVLRVPLLSQQVGEPRLRAGAFTRACVLHTRCDTARYWLSCLYVCPSRSARRGSRQRLRGAGSGRLRLRHGVCRKVRRAEAPQAQAGQHHEHTAGRHGRRRRLRRQPDAHLRAAAVRFSRCNGLDERARLRSRTSG
jgi:hypothetical protein